MTFEVHAGGIYKAPFPFTDLSSQKARPALALSEPDENGDVRFAFITTAVPNDPAAALALNRRVMVTGGAGFWGLQVVAKLHEYGATQIEIADLDRYDPSAPLRACPRRLDDSRRAVNDVRLHLFHLAAVRPQVRAC